jgi:polyhydroxyalkanoate synthase
MATGTHLIASMTPQRSFRAINEAVEAHFDPLGVVVPLLHAQLAWATHPQELAEAATELSTRVLALQWHSWRRMLGLPSEDVEKPHPDDSRFADPVWQESATWDVAKQWYLLTTHHTQDMLYRSPGMSSRDRRRAAFWWREWLNAMAPTNFLPSNPVALQKAAETNGESLLRGLRIFLDDALAGNIRMTRPDDFKVGVNLATTPGKVVLQNRLLEVIHYAPTATQTYRTPLLIVTPWINKYYIPLLSG